MPTTKRPQHGKTAGRAKKAGAPGVYRVRDVGDRLCNRLRGFYEAVKGLAQHSGGQDIPYEEIGLLLQTIIGIIQATVPMMACKCSERGCPLCQQRGWLSTMNLIALWKRQRAQLSSEGCLPQPMRDEPPMDELYVALNLRRAMASILSSSAEPTQNESAPSLPEASSPLPETSSNTNGQQAKESSAPA